MTSQPIEKRFRNHLSVARSNRPGAGGSSLLSEEIRQCGEASFDIRVVAATRLRQCAELLEQRFILQLGTLAPAGLNTQSGGKRNYQLSEIGRKKIGAAIKAAELRRKLARPSKA